MLISLNETEKAIIYAFVASQKSKLFDRKFHLRAYLKSHSELGEEVLEKLGQLEQRMDMDINIFETLARKMLKNPP